MCVCVNLLPFRMIFRRCRTTTTDFSLRVFLCNTYEYAYKTDRLDGIENYKKKNEIKNPRASVVYETHGEVKVIINKNNFDARYAYYFVFGDNFFFF